MSTTTAEMRAQAQEEILRAPQKGAQQAAEAKRHGAPDFVAEAQGEAEVLAEELAGSVRMIAAIIKETFASHKSAPVSSHGGPQE
jgi:hypothetical protein